MVVERKSRIGGNEFASYAIPTMQLLIFFHRFKYVLDWFRNVGSCDMSNV
jgi:hypothetical protein